MLVDSGGFASLFERARVVEINGLGAIMEDVASLALYLAADAAAQINGASLSIDGGWTAR